MFFLLPMSCFQSEVETVEVEQAATEKEVKSTIKRTLVAPDNSQVKLPSQMASEQPISEALDWGAYPFLNTSEGVQSLQERFNVPDGYNRVEVLEGGFAHWLRGIPTLDRQKVYSFRGEAIRNASAIAVVPMSVGRGDIQQCADSILRLYSEYLWSQGAADDWGIHFTSGDLSRWKNWKKGQRFKVQGNAVSRLDSGVFDDSYGQYQNWLHHAFVYAGTQSLHLDSNPVALTDSIQPGDFFVSPGSPGHAVIVLDVATAPERPPLALLGQGFMPAQEFHVLTDTGAHVHEHWFELPQEKGAYLLNPSYYAIPREAVFRF